MKRLGTIIMRCFAVFVANALSVIGAGAIAGIDILQSCLIAGLSGVATVVGGLARAYLVDGELSKEDVNKVFANAPSGKKNGTSAQTV
jgi:hypothetical protein